MNWSCVILTIKWAYSTYIVTSLKGTSSWSDKGIETEIWLLPRYIGHFSTATSISYNFSVLTKSVQVWLFNDGAMIKVKVCANFHWNWLVTFSETFTSFRIYFVTTWTWYDISREVVVALSTLEQCHHVFV